LSGIGKNTFRPDPISLGAPVMGKNSRAVSVIFTTVLQVRLVSRIVSILII
jgi:hypothetical protein